MNDPAATLVEPAATTDFPPALDTFLHLSDYFSLGHWAIVALDKMGAPNIPQVVGQWFAGDWTEVARSSHALHNMGEFCEVAGLGIKADLALVERSWDGKAADSAFAYFSNLADTLFRESSALRDVAEQYNAAAIGVMKAAQGVGSLIEALCDLAIAAGIELAAAAASAPTVVGPIISGIAGAATVIKGVKVIAKIMAIKGTIMMLLDELMGGVLGGLGPLRGFNGIDLPGAYDNPAV